MQGIAINGTMLHEVRMLMAPYQEGTVYMNGIVGADTVLNARNLAKVEMPNRRGFISE